MPTAGGRAGEQPAVVPPRQAAVKYHSGIGNIGGDEAFDPTNLRCFLLSLRRNERLSKAKLFQDSPSACLLAPIG